MEGVIILLVIIGLPLLACIPAIALVRDMQREARGYDAMARSMRRMKDEDPDALRVVGRAFKDTFK